MCSCQVSAERLKTCFTGPSSEQIRLLWVVRCLYSYFEKGCRKKYTRQSRKVLWVRMAREAIVVCLRVSGSTATVSGIVYWSYPIFPFGILACTFFPTTFLEIAVYFKRLRTTRALVKIGTREEGFSPPTECHRRFSRALAYSAGSSILKECERPLVA